MWLIASLPPFKHLCRCFIFCFISLYSMWLVLLILNYMFLFYFFCTCRPGESNQQPSDNKTLAPPSQWLASFAPILCGIVFCEAPGNQLLKGAMRWLLVILLIICSIVKYWNYLGSLDGESVFYSTNICICFLTGEITNIGCEITLYVYWSKKHKVEIFPSET